MSLWLPKKNKKDVHCRDNRIKQYDESDYLDKPLNAESRVNLKTEKEAEKMQLPSTPYLEEGSSRVQVSDMRHLAEKSFRHDLLSKFPLFSDLSCST